MQGVLDLVHKPLLLVAMLRSLVRREGLAGLARLGSRHRVPLDRALTASECRVAVRAGGVALEVAVGVGVRSGSASDAVAVLGEIVIGSSELPPVSVPLIGVSHS